MKIGALAAIGLVSLLTFSGGFSKRVLADQSDGTSEGLPGRRDGGGTRGADCAMLGKQLTALVPKNNLALTTAGYPRLFFYIPKSPTPKQVEFVLTDESDTQVYETTFMTPGTAGVNEVSLTDKAVSPLKTGKNYHWYLSEICNPNNRAEDIVVEGWVRRVSLNPDLAHNLENVSPEERATLYASANLWQEALGTLADLRRAHPDDSTITTNWAKLLQSVGLDTIAGEPLNKDGFSRKSQVVNQANSTL